MNNYDNGGKESLFKQMVLDQQDICKEKKNLDLTLYTK